MRPVRALALLLAVGTAGATPIPGWHTGHHRGPPAREPCGGYRTFGPQRVVAVSEDSGGSVDIQSAVTVGGGAGDGGVTLVLPPEPYASMALVSARAAVCVAAQSDPFDTAQKTLPNPAVAGAVYTLGHTDLAGLYLVDQLGIVIDYGTYTADLAAGTVTMADPLNLAAYTQPLVARLTWETGAPRTWEPVVWSPPAGFQLSIADPGGLNAVHVLGEVIVPAGGTVTVSGTPQRLPARLMSGTITGTWTAGSLPPGTSLTQDPPGLSPGLYLVEP